MYVINSILIGLFGLGIIISRMNISDWIKELDKKEHKLYILYPLSEWLLNKSGLAKGLRKSSKNAASIKALYVTGKPEAVQRLLWCKRISMMIMILQLFNILSLMAGLMSMENVDLIDGRFISRPEAGDGSKTVSLNVDVEDTEEGADNGRADRYLLEDFTINVEERYYTEQEFEEIIDKAIDYLEIKVLGVNEATDRIYDNLNFCNRIPGTGIAVEWKTENRNLIRSDGTVHNEDIQGDGVRTTVTATLSYHGQKAEHRMSFVIRPKKYSQQEFIYQELQEEIGEASNRTAMDDFLELPEVTNNYRLKWSSKTDNSPRILLLLGFVMVALIWVYEDKTIDKQMKQRRDQLLLDYPELVNKFTLLVNAGMTVKQAWMKLSEDYLDVFSKKKHYAYEEMLITARELKLGLAENIAYEQYGRRISLIPYIKFSSLISQNIKKGNKGFTELLMKEAMEAFEERKEIAKRMGEEAGTKLLIPMMIMLLIVFLIILIPAFLSFQI